MEKQQAKIVKGERNTKKKLAYFLIAEPPPSLWKDSERRAERQTKNKVFQVWLSRAALRNSCESDVIEKVYDNRNQEIRLQPVKVDDVSDTVVLVDCDAKDLKERGMYSVMLSRYEQGLERIRKGIEGKGTKQRDPLQRRLGRLQEKYPRAAKAYDVQFTYDNGDKAVSMSYRRNGETVEGMSAMHGKYLLRTTLDSRDETSIWTFYNVIRTVEETFKTLKTDLDIRPVFHKTDGGTKAHLNLVILTCWIVSTTRYRLRENRITVRWSELLCILSAQVCVIAGSRLTATTG